MKRVARSALVEAPAPALYALVEEIEAYPSFLPWCVGAEVLERTPSSTKATLTAGIGGLRQSFTTLNANQPGRSIDMRLVEGPFRHFSATWRFEPLGEKACRIDFTMEYEFSSGALAKVLEPLFGRIADTMVNAFARRAASVHGPAAR